MSTYRLTVIGPGDEVLDEIPLDGLDLSNGGHQAYVGFQVHGAMDGTHAAACAALPEPGAD